MMILAVRPTFRHRLEVAVDRTTKWLQAMRRLPMPDPTEAGTLRNRPRRPA